MINLKSHTNSKESACSVGDLGLIPGLGRLPGGGHGNTLPVFLPGEPHGQKSLVGHSPRGLTELDTTEAAEHTHQSLYLAEFGGFKSSGKVFLVFWIMLLHFRYLMNS